MGLSRSFILTLLLICLCVTHGASGIEFLFSQDDMSISSSYDVDDSVAVEEEASATYGSGITDYREVSGNGYVYASQQLSSGNYRAVLGAHGPDGGAVSAWAAMTPTTLNALQTASVRGYNAFAFVDGEQNYGDGRANTWQDAFVEDGWLSSAQGLTLGSSIFSTQNTRAHGLEPYATGFAGIYSPTQNGGNSQFAVISMGAANDGFIGGRLGAEVIRTPEYEDPFVYGSRIEASGNEAAGLVAGAGTVEDDLSDNDIVLGGPFDTDLDGIFAIINSEEHPNAHGAIIGAIGAGSKSKASANYIEAGTNGRESYAYGEDIRARGNKLAAAAAAAGSFETNSLETDWDYFSRLAIDGAIAGAAGVGKDSRASAGYLEAGTDPQETYALGEDLKAKGKKFAAVAAGAGSLEMDKGSSFFGDYSYLDVDGALAGAAGVGKDSRASAGYLEAGTDPQETYALGEDLKAKGKKFAAVAAGAGFLYANEYSFPLSYSDYLEIDGAIAGAVGSGKNSRASAGYLKASTDYWDTYALGEDLKAKGKKFAAVAAGAGSLEMETESSFFGDDSSLNIEGALAGAAGVGKGGRASARYLEASTDYWDTYAFGRKLNAKGSTFAAAAAGAGSLGMDKGSSFFEDHSSLDIDGALAGTAGLGKDSRASAGYLEAGIDNWDVETYAFGRKLDAKGNDLAAVLTASGDLYLDSQAVIEGKGALAGGLAAGDDSKVSAGMVETFTEYGKTMAKVKNLKAVGEKGVLAGSLAIYGPVSGTLPVSLSTTFISLDQGALRNADFKAKVDAVGTPVLTAMGDADLDDALGGASAFTLNPSGFSPGFIDPSKTHAFMYAEAKQGQPSVRFVSVT